MQKTPNSRENIQLTEHCCHSVNRFTEKGIQVQFLLHKTKIIRHRVGSGQTLRQCYLLTHDGFQFLWYLVQIWLSFSAESAVSDSFRVRYVDLPGISLWGTLMASNPSYSNPTNISVWMNKHRIVFCSWLIVLCLASNMIAEQNHQIKDYHSNITVE